MNPLRVQILINPAELPDLERAVLELEGQPETVSTKILRVALIQALSLASNERRSSSTTNAQVIEIEVS